MNEVGMEKNKTRDQGDDAVRGAETRVLLPLVQVLFKLVAQYGRAESPKNPLHKKMTFMFKVERAWRFYRTAPGED